MDVIKNYRLTKVLSIVSFTSFILAVVIFDKTPSSSGYELSIYNALPLFFWIFVIVSITISIGIIFLSSIFMKSNYWHYGFLSLSISYFLLLLLPTLRGYILYGRGSGDILAHIGWTKDLLNTGHFFGDFYPINHILLLNLKYTGLSLESASNFMSAFFSLVYIILIYLLAREISKNWRQALFILAFATPLLFSSFHVSVSPSIFSTFMLPLLLYSYHKIEKSNKKFKFKIIALIIIFLTVFFHPITTIIAIVILIVFEIFTLFKDKFAFQKSWKYNSLDLIIISSVSFFSWISSFETPLMGIRNIFMGILHQTEISIVGTYKSILNEANLPILQMIEISFNRYGPILIYFTISFVCLFFILKRVRKKTVGYFEISYSLQFLVGVAFMIMFLFVYLIEFDLLRISRYAILMATILCGLVLYTQIDRIRRKNKKRIIAGIIFFIIGSVSILGILNIYDSSRVSKANDHLTYMEDNGVRWFLENRNRQIPLIASGLDLFKNEIYYFGSETFLDNKGEFDAMIPSHFGYDKNETLGESFEYKKRYMITNEFNRQAHLVFPMEVRSKAHQYLNEDFLRLNNDFTVIKIYENTEFECWLVGS